MCWCEKVPHNLKVTITANVSILEMSLTEMLDLFKYIYSAKHDNVAAKRSYLHHCHCLQTALLVNNISHLALKANHLIEKYLDFI